MRLKIFGLFTAVLFVAACQTAPEESAEATGEGAATAAQPTPPAATAPAPAQPQVAAQAAPGPRPGSQEDLVYNVGDRVFFDFDKFDIKPEVRETLKNQAAWLRKFPSVTVTIQGHCDERGTREYNLALGERRAQAVKDYLVSLGVDPARVATISYGKERPAALGHTEAAWAQNRRGITVVN
jgi:peptidoglycan-associated lipoprotein